MGLLCIIIKNLYSQLIIFGLIINIIECKFFMKFVLKIKTNKDKSTEIFLPLHLKPTNMRTCMPRARRGQQKVQILKKSTMLCPSKNYYSKSVHNTLCIMLSKHCTLYSISNKDIYSQKLGRCLSFYVALLQITLNM